MGAILLLMVGGCESLDNRLHDTEAVAKPGDIYIARQGGGCLGACPVYNIYVFKDGRVVFQGIQNTAAAGVRRKRISPKNFEALRRELIRTNLLQAPEAKECITDQPAVRIEADFGDCLMSRIVDFGCISDRKNLWPTVKLIDDIAGARMWTYPSRR